MDIEISKHYNGYEGEPEIQLIRNLTNGAKIRLSIWEGYFDRIMSAITVDSTGWTSLAYYYHLHEGWYEESPWEIKDIKKAVEQFERIDTATLDEKTKLVFYDVYDFFINARDANENVWIAYN